MKNFKHHLKVQKHLRRFARLLARCFRDVKRKHKVVFYVNKHGQIRSKLK